MSVVLIVATVVSILNRRDEARNTFNGDLDAAAFITGSSIGITLDQASGLADIAAADVEPESLVRFTGAADVCVFADGAADCTGNDLSTSRYFEVGRERSAVSGTAVAVPDQETNSVLVVSERGRTIAIRLGVDALIGPIGASALAGYADEIDVNVHVLDDASASDHAARDDIDSVEQVPNAVVVGAIEVDLTSGADVGLTGGNTGLYAMLLLLGTGLLAVAGWTFFADRRSLERRAATDPLTGLVNRSEFERLSEEAIAAADRFRSGLCVMLIDLDRFKAVNDSQGHHVGDRVLRACAERLMGAVRDTDVVGRWGGDEFVILMPGLENGTAVRASAERIGAALDDRPIIDDLSISGSIGAAVYPRHGARFDDLVRAADDAMYRAKTTGVTFRLAEAIDPDATNRIIRDDDVYVGPDRRRAPADTNS